MNAGRQFWCALLAMFAGNCLAASPGIRLVVVEGQGALNNVEARRAKDPVVRVEDAEGRPVAGAVVNFILPAHGPGGVFAGGEMSLTATAGDDGMVTARGLRPNRTPGAFEIRVTASAGGETVTAAVRQVNVTSAESGGPPSRRYLWLAVIGGAALGGVVAATRGGSPGQTAAAPPGTTVTPGIPSFGPPR